MGSKINANKALMASPKKSKPVLLALGDKKAKGAEKLKKKKAADPRKNWMPNRY